ncbi:MAG: large conductance mechanosensitive channel protein MscL [Butyricicoccaceae bacterium]
MKKFLEEFKTFALRGNVMDLAVGVIIGAAFQSIVTSLTDNIITPILNIFGNAELDFSGLVLRIGGANIKYGAFISSVIDFIIMAFIIFLMVKAVNKLTSIGTKPEAPAAPTTKVCPFCKSEIAIEATRCPHCTSELAEKEAV